MPRLDEQQQDKWIYRIIRNLSRNPVDERRSLIQITQCAFKTPFMHFSSKNLVKTTQGIAVFTGIAQSCARTHVPVPDANASPRGPVDLAERTDEEGAGYFWGWRLFM